MTTDELTVYGKRTGSLWDRRIGGRYELTAIVDDGGLGMWVRLQRLGNGHELEMSVYNLGRNFVTVPDVAEPAEDDPMPWLGVASRPEPIEPSDDVPLAAWEIELLRGPTAHLFGDLIRIGGEALYRVVDADGKAILEPKPAPTPPSDDPALARGLLEYALHLCVNGERAPGGDETWAEFSRNAEAWLRAHPAPVPNAALLPWQEPHSAPLWRHKTGAVHRAATLRAWGSEPPDDWQGGYFISADLIERLLAKYGRNSGWDEIDAILDAADEATS